MSPEMKQKIIQELPTWLYKILVTSFLSVILYFVMDIHNDLKKTQDKANKTESRLDTFEEKQAGRHALIDRNFQIVDHNIDILFERTKDLQ